MVKHWQKLPQVNFWFSSKSDDPIRKWSIVRDRHVQNHPFFKVSFPWYENNFLGMSEPSFRKSHRKFVWPFVTCQKWLFWLKISTWNRIFFDYSNELHMVRSNSGIFFRFFWSSAWNLNLNWSSYIFLSALLLPLYSRIF